MTQYYRVTDATRHELSAEQYAALQANGKAAALRLYVEDAKPTPGASQVVIVGSVIVDATTARQTWALRPKTQAELDTEANEAEASQILQGIDTASTRIQAYNANPDVGGTNLERIVKLETRTATLELWVRDIHRAIRYLLRLVRSWR